MKIQTLSIMSLIIGLTSCLEESENTSSAYTIVFDENSLASMSLAVKGLNGSAGGILGSANADSNATLAVKQAVEEKEYCDSGYISIVGDVDENTGGTMTGTYSNCEIDGATANGSIVLTISFLQNGQFKMLGNGGLSITGIPEMPYVGYNNLTIEALFSSSGYNISMEMRGDINMVSEELTGTFGLYALQSGSTEVYVFTGADNTSFTYTFDGQTSDCTLNSQAINCAYTGF